jgi:hypothetical protein
LNTAALGLPRNTPGDATGSSDVSNTHLRPGPRTNAIVKPFGWPVLTYVITAPVPYWAERAIRKPAATCARAASSQARISWNFNESW